MRNDVRSLQSSEYRAAPQVHTNDQNLTGYITTATNCASVAPATVDSTPPADRQASRVQIQRGGLGFSPYDARESGYARMMSSEFQLATPLVTARDVSVPVHHVRLPDPSSMSHHATSGERRSDNLLPSRSPTPPPPPSLTFQPANSDPLDAGGTKKRKSRLLGVATSSKNIGSIPLVKPITASSFSGQKIGREAVILEHCTTSSGEILPHRLASCSDSEKKDRESDSDTQWSGSLRSRGTEEGKKEALTMYVLEGAVKREEEKEGEEERGERASEGSQVVTVEGRRYGSRVTRSRAAAAKLASDSELSQSDSEPAAVAEGSNQRKRLLRRCKSARDGGREKERTCSTLEGEGERERETPEEVVEESSDEDDATLVREVKTEGGGPVSMRTRSQTDSSQSDNELPPPHPRPPPPPSPPPPAAACQREVLRLRRRNKPATVRGRLHRRPRDLDTSESESSSNTAAITTTTRDPPSSSLQHPTLLPSRGATTVTAVEEEEEEEDRESVKVEQWQQFL